VNALRGDENFSHLYSNVNNEEHIMAEDEEEVCFCQCFSSKIDLSKLSLVFLLLRSQGQIRDMLDDVQLGGKNQQAQRIEG
jgi:hypothetical protein